MFQLRRPIRRLEFKLQLAFLEHSKLKLELQTPPLLNAAASIDDYFASPGCHTPIPF